MDLNNYNSDFSYLLAARLKIQITHFRQNRIKSDVDSVLKNVDLILN